MFSDKEEEDGGGGEAGGERGKKKRKKERKEEEIRKGTSTGKKKKESKNSFVFFLYSSQNAFLLKAPLPELAQMLFLQTPHPLVISFLPLEMVLLVMAMVSCRPLSCSKLVSFTASVPPLFPGTVGPQDLLARSACAVLVRLPSSSSGDESRIYVNMF